jgi:hypothetical protein
MNQQKGTHIMENTYIDIEAYVRQAQQQRSDALGELLSAAWRKIRQRCSTWQQYLVGKRVNTIKLA